MVYAHVLIARDDSLHVTIRVGTRFQSVEEEESLIPHILETIVEPSGHLGLLQARLIRWSKDNEFFIHEIDAVSGGLPTNIDIVEHIHLLEKAALEVAAARDQVRKENESLKLQVEKERQCGVHYWEIYKQKQMEAALLEHEGQIAEHELQCDHLRQARVKRAVWVQDNFH